MRRREFITFLGGGAAAAWPLAARAQQQAMPVVGYLGPGTHVVAVYRGLSEAGYVEGKSVAIEYRWAEGRYDQLPPLAADLVRRKVTVIVALTTPAALAAKAATKSIPIVFVIGSDPVAAGLVASLNQPGGNLTGIYNLFLEVVAKRLQLLHELMPAAQSIAYLVNPSNPVVAEIEAKELQVAARTLGVRLLVLNASDQSEFEAAFATLVREPAGGLVVGSDILFMDHIDQLITLAARLGMPAIYPNREATARGGLMSYGTDILDAERQSGVLAGRILKGAKPAELPVEQVTKIELVINVKTAKALGLVFPLPLLGRADEVIE